MLSGRLPSLGRAIAVRLFSTEGKNATTALYNLHVERGGKMVSFADFLLPVQYDKHGISDSHLYTRQHVSLFDVSHMLQTEIMGKGCLEFLETLCTADLMQQKEQVAALTVFTNDKGGILDDLIVTKISDDHLYLVSNANRRGQDQRLLQKALEIHKSQNKNSKIRIRFFEPNERSILALQGPQAAEVLQKLTDVDLSKLYFMQSINGSVAGSGACRITRCGYTGEDGFEISMPSFKSYDVAVEILKDGTVKLAGLGARDSLRLEAGLCLYGTDMDEQTTPVEASLQWLVAKGRRERKGFPGADVILEQIKKCPLKKRVGMLNLEGPPARRDTEIYSADGQRKIGVVTSGCPSPTLGSNIAMGYVPNDLSKAGTKVKLKIRDKMYDAEVAKMPFVPTKYYTKPK